ncbi:MAG: glycosyltransferase [Christensenellales bacterium]|jgi:glycosyltransferase involved in cell wall biosynthesis
MITISLCMIVKNEEKVLARCLESVRAAVDEIIIVDTGSKDKTKEIAYRFTDKVYDFPWIEDFSAARNASFSYATCDYQMWLDADDVLEPRELEKLIRLKQTLSPEVDIVTMRYNTHFDERGNPVLTSNRERLLRRERRYRWQDPVHECIPLVGNVHYSDITVSHRKIVEPGAPVSFRNLRIYEKLEAEGKPMTPRQLYYYARELKDHQLYDRAAEKFRMFLDTGLGWHEDTIAACHSLGVCYRMLKQPDKMLPALTRSFQYGTPRAEVLCEMAQYFRGQGRDDLAIAWYEIAADLKPPQGNAGFLLWDYWGYVPHLELCVLHYRKGDIEKALWHNEQAAKIKPGSAAVQLNRQFFDTLRQNRQAAENAAANQTD